MSNINSKFNNPTSFQQDMARGNTTCFLLKKKKVTYFVNIGRKRRNSEDEEMGECSRPFMRRSSKTIKLSELKRQKTGFQKRSTRGALLGKHIKYAPS
jgi:hypothetical protein